MLPLLEYEAIRHVSSDDVLVDCLYLSLARIHIVPRLVDNVLLELLHPNYDSSTALCLGYSEFLSNRSKYPESEPCEVCGH